MKPINYGQRYSNWKGREIPIGELHNISRVRDLRGAIETEKWHDTRGRWSNGGQRGRGGRGEEVEEEEEEESRTRRLITKYVIRAAACLFAVTGTDIIKVDGGIACLEEWAGGQGVTGSFVHLKRNYPWANFSSFLFPTTSQHF